MTLPEIHGAYIVEPSPTSLVVPCVPCVPGVPSQGGRCGTSLRPSASVVPPPGDGIVLAREVIDGLGFLD